MSGIRMAAIVRALVAAALAGGGPAAAQTLDREVWSREELEAAGVQRFADVVQLLDPWSVSVDGHGWIVSPDALPAAALSRAGLPEWVLLVDDQRVDVSGPGGAWFTELVPVLVHQIDSVEVSRTPALAGGGLSSRGVIRVHARRPAAGASALAWARAGSETGDPGPYAYTPLATPNVDRIGHDLALVAGYGGRRWGAELSAREIANSVTDPELESRYDTHPLQVYTTVRGPAVLAHAEALGGRHTLMAARPVQDGFAFMPASGRLERANVASTQAGVSGTISTGDGREVTYRLSRAAQSYEPLPDRVPGDTSHRRTVSHGSVELRWRGGPWLWLAGVGGERRALHLPAIPAESRAHGTLYGAAERQTGRGWGQRAAAAVAVGGGRVAFRGSAGAGWSPDSARSLVGSLSVAQHLADEGGGWMDARLLDVASPGDLSDRVLVQGDVAWRQPLVRGVVVEVGGTITSVSAHGGDPAAVGGAEDRPPALAEGLEGVRVRARVSVDGAAGPRLRGRLSFHSVAPLTASGDGGAADATVPGHVALGAVSYNPVPTLRVGAVVDLRSGTDWSGVDPAALDGTVGGRLDPWARLDLTIEKWAWKRRLRAQLVVRNLADAPERYHPLGARFAQRYLLSGSLALPPRS